MPLKIFRVSSVTAPYEDFSKIPADRLEFATDRGTKTHDYLHAYIQGLWAIKPEGAEGYCESGERWIDSNVVRVISCERHYVDEALGFGGHPDAVVEVKSRKIWIPDYKTPVNVAKSWALKLAAYKHLVCKAHRFNPDNVICGALMLSPTGGNAKFQRGEDRWAADFAIFLGLLNAAKYFKGGDHEDFR